MKCCYLSIKTVITTPQSETEQPPLGSYKIKNLNDELDKVRVPINKDTDEQVADLLFGVFVG